MIRACPPVAVLVILASAALSQPALPPPRPRDLSPPSPPSIPTAPPYESKLERLAELMGTLAFMRDLCGDGDGAAWRAKMTELLDSEGTSLERRDRLAGAFNRGFNGYRTTYRRCTPAAAVVIDRAFAEGSKLASELSARFGG